MCHAKNARGGSLAKGSLAISFSIEKSLSVAKSTPSQSLVECQTGLEGAKWNHVN